LFDAMSIINFLHGLLPIGTIHENEGTWDLLPPLRSKRHGCAATAIRDNTIVVMGGHNGNTEMESVDVYTYENGTWTVQVGTPMKTRRLGSVAATLKSDEAAASSECIVVVGGHNGRVLDSAERYHPRLDMWTESQRFPSHGIFNAAAVAIKDRLYVIGGHTGRNSTNEMHVFDANFCTWTAAPAMQENRFHLGAAVLGKYIYVIGGENDSGALRTMERYDTESRTWTTLPPMFSKRKGCVAAGVGEEIYVFGGHDGYQVLTSCERYNTVTQSWCPIPSMKLKRFGSAIASLGRNIFVIGGFDGRNPMDSVEVFTVPSHTETTVTQLTTDHGDNFTSEEETPEDGNSTMNSGTKRQTLNGEEGPPDELQCPITGDVMVDPVVASDGYSYEREAIEEWFRRFPRSSMPRSPSTNGSIERKLFPNHNLKSLCRQYADSNFVDKQISGESNIN